MNKNVKVAKELIKLAKSLVAKQNIAKEIISLQLIAKGQKQLKKYIRQRIKDDYTDQLQLSTEVGKINKTVKDKLKKIPINYHRIVYDWLIDGNQIPQEDVQKMINSIKRYQIIKKNNSKAPNINTFKTYGELISYIDKFNQNNNLQFLQKRNDARNTNLPFKKIKTKGSFSMYIIEDDQYQDFNRLYGNNNNSKEGGLIATTGWCVALGIGHFEYYKAPYYLITTSNNQPEALVHINSRQFKDREDYEYQGNNKQVYELVIQLLDDNNELNYEGDFQVLLKYLPNQQKQEIIDELIDEKVFVYLLSCIKKGYLPNTLSNQQNQEIIDWFIDKRQFEKLLDYIKEGYLLNTLSNQQNQEIIDWFIDKKWFVYLIKYIKRGDLPELSNQQKQKTIDNLIDERCFGELFHYIKEGYLPKLSNQQKQKIIDYCIDKESFYGLLDYIKEGDLPELSNQQKQEIIDWFIDEKRIKDLFDYIKEGCLPELSNQQNQKIIDYCIDKELFWKLSSYIEEGYLSKSSNQQKQKIIDYFIDEKKIGILLSYIEKGYLPNTLSNQQSQKAIDWFINEERFNTLFDYIKEGYLPELSNQQKQRIREKDQNVKISKQLINIAKSLIDI